MSSTASAAPIGALGRLADRAFRHRRRVLAGWVGLLVLAIVAGGALAGTYAVDYATPGSESKAAADTLGRAFGGRSADSVDVVWRADRPATAPAVTARIDAFLARAGRLEGIQRGTTTRGAEVSRDGRTAVVRMPLDRVSDRVPKTTGQRLVALSRQADGAGLRLALGGDLEGLTADSSSASELVGVSVAALVLVLTFGGLIAAGLPLVTALFGIGIAASLVGVLAAVVDTPDWALQVAILMGLGVGIDYALLILTRHRAALHAGRTPREAVIEAMSTAGRSVVIAGGTVVISLLGLFLMGLPYLYGVALAASLAVLVVLAASITLLPALLGFAGPRIDRLRIPGVGRTPRDAQRTPAARWARAVQRRPLVAALVAAAVLVALASPVLGIRFGFPDAGNDAKGTTTRTAYDLLAQGFGPGSNGPLLAVAATPAAADRAKAQRLASTLRREPGVAAVAAPQASPDGATTLLAITPTTSPQAKATQDLITRLRDDPLARSGLHVDVGGATAATVDQGRATANRLPLFIGAVIVLSFLLLLAAFHAPIVALKAGVMNLLSIGAAYGVVALVAEGGWAGRLVGIDTDLPIPPFIPVMMFAIVFGLSMDYEVFLISRIREERARTGDARTAVVDGLARTARVITAAAAIMVAVFAAFALSPEVFLKLIGIGLATAILVDATIVRLVLVPAVMQLLGERSWWSPRWLERMLPSAPLEAPASAR